MQIKSQRQIYLDNLKAKTREFGLKIIEDYNAGMPVPQIAQKYTNPKTGKPYSAGRIHAIIKQMREESKSV